MDDQSHPSMWQRQCGLVKIVQLDKYGCGVACLAMVSGRSYGEARHDFNGLGLASRRGCRPALSTSMGELRMAIASAGLMTETRRWKGWSDVNGLGIFKMKDDWHGEAGRGKWHWAVAFRHPAFGITVFDPHMYAPSFEHMPLDVECVRFSLYEPKGFWLQVEQRVPLCIDV